MLTSCIQLAIRMVPSYLMFGLQSENKFNVKLFHFLLRNFLTSLLGNAIK